MNCVLVAIILIGIPFLMMLPMIISMEQDYRALKKLNNDPNVLKTQWD